MSLLNKILLGFIILLSLAFFYMAARTLKTHQAWRTTTQAYEKALQEALNLQEEFKEGVTEDGKTVKDGIRQVALGLDKALLGRGRVWRNSSPSGRPTAQGADGSFDLVVDLDSPDHQIGEKMVLHVFEDKLAIDGGQYLGVFKVTSVDEKKVTLKPAMKMNPEEYNRVAASTGPWSIYERMPADRYDMFEGLTEDDLRAKVPGPLLAEFLKHGKPAEPGDPEECVVDGKYARPLWDYERAISYEHARRSELTDLNNAATRDLETVKTALAQAEAQNKVHEQEKAGAEKELAVMESERDAVKAHLDEVEKALAARQAEIQGAIAKIQAMVSEIARIQLEATRKINERTRAAMQAGSGK